MSEMESLEDQVFSRVIQFMKDNQVSCSEAVYQNDNVITNAYEFIDDLYQLVQPYLPNDEV